VGELGAGEEERQRGRVQASAVASAEVGGRRPAATRGGVDGVWPPRGGRALPRSARVRAASRGTAQGWAGEARDRRGRGPGRLRPWAGKLSGGLLSEMKFFSFYFSNKQN